MTAHVREATDDDLAPLMTLLAEINNLHAEALPHIYAPVSGGDATEQYLLRIIGSDLLHLRVAEVAGEVVGFVVFQEEQAPDTPVHMPRRWVLISLIVVGEASRSQGVGTELLRQVQAWARDHDISDIELQVAEFNTSAIAWYEALGFRSRYRHMAWSASDAADVPAGRSRDTW